MLCVQGRRRGQEVWLVAVAVVGARTVAVRNHACRIPETTRQETVHFTSRAADDEAAGCEHGIVSEGGVSGAGVKTAGVAREQRGVGADVAEALSEKTVGQRNTSARGPLMKVASSMKPHMHATHALERGAACGGLEGELRAAPDWRQELSIAQRSTLCQVRLQILTHLGTVWNDVALERAGCPGEKAT